ncbi:MAG: hypothetical protein LUE89_00045 [Clostridiales bacterium]|nr:hypothetical protein [Clostridiales bacterium]
MTKDEAVRVFRAQTPVVLMHGNENVIGYSHDVLYDRICELHYRILENGEKMFYLSVTDGKGEYTGGPECYRPATSEEIAAYRQKEERHGYEGI